MRIYIMLILFIFSFQGWAEKPLNDAEIAEVMEISQKVRFDFATLALTKGESEEVKDFASYILTDYRDELTPVPHFKKSQSRNANALKKDIKAMSSQLKKLKGKEFDQAYLTMQMDLHKRLLKDIQDGLIPAAKNPELKKALGKVHDQIDDYVDDTLDTYISINK